MSIEDLFDLTIKKNASDLHLIPGYYPTLRINGQLVSLVELSILNANDIENLIIPLLNETNKNLLFTNKELDFSHSFKSFRFRVNYYYSRGLLAASFRLIPNKIKTLKELYLPPVLEKLIHFNQGLVLVTGQSGQGKSTTLASIINLINNSHHKHIVTIEDPIEYVYPASKSIISQREIGNDTLHWRYALKSVLREDPDVILIGEMRDQETIRSALNISETGHLVLSTLHTTTSSQTIDRIIDVFDSEEQSQIRLMLSANLKAIICQKLIYSEKYNQRFPACEILFNNSAISNLIREGKTYLIDNVILTSSQESMILLEKSLFDLYQNGIITKDQAIINSFRQSQIKKLLKI